MIRSRRRAVAVHLARFAAALAMIAGTTSVLAPAAPSFAYTAYVFSATLLDGSGNPIVGSGVQLAGTWGQTFATTDSNGLFSITAPGGPATFSASIPVAAANYYTYYTSLTGQVDLTADVTGDTMKLPPLTQVTVNVTDANNQPVAGAGVGIYDQSNYSLAGVDTAAALTGAYIEGGSGANYRYDGLTDSTGTAVLGMYVDPTNPSDASIQITLAGGASTFITNETVDLGAPVPISLPPLYQFSGTLLDGYGNPVAGEQVGLSGSWGQTSSTTGSDGSFTVSAPAGASTFSTGIPMAGANGYTYLTALTGQVDLTGNVTGDTLRMPAPTPVTVDVTDSNNQPVPGAAVAVYDHSDYSIPNLDTAGALTGAYIEGGSSANFRYDGLTDSTGTAVLDMYVDPTNPSDASIQVTPANGPYTFATNETVDLGSPLPISLPAMYTFSGHMLDASGNPFTGGVQLAGPWGQTSAIPDSTGYFAMTAPAGPATFSAAIPVPAGGNYTYSTVLDGQIDLTGDVTNDTVQMPPLTPVTVTVTDSNGQPVMGAAVAVYDHSDYSIPNLDTAGALTGAYIEGGSSANFRYDGLTDSTGTAVLDMYVDPTNPSDASIQVTPAPNAIVAPNSEDLSVVLGSPIAVSLATASGTVTSSSGTLSGQTVTASSTTTSTSSTTTSSGSYSLTVAPGTYTMTTSGTIGDPTTYTASVPDVSIQVGSTLDAALPDRVQTLTVVDSSGNPVAAATVSGPCTAISFPLFGGTATGTQCVNEKTDGTGHAGLDLLPGDPVALTVTPAAGSGLAAATVTVDPSGSGPTTVVLKKTSQTSVSVLPTSSPAPNQPVLFVAAVAPTDGGGTVAFYLDGSTIPVPGCTARPLVRSSTGYSAACPYDQTEAVGPHQVTATYSGDAVYAGSTGTGTYQVRSAGLVAAR